MYGMLKATINLNSTVSPDSKPYRSSVAGIFFLLHTLYDSAHIRSQKMSSNVGLTTPRGSGTSGYVQRNLSYYRPRDNNTTSSSSYYNSDSQEKLKHQQRQPDQQILNHDRLREVEVRVFELRDRLEDEG